MIPIAYVAGKDPTEEIGGHSSYVRAHARAAVHAGYEPHIFCVAERNGIEQKDYGFIHRRVSSLRPYRAILAPLHSQLLLDPLECFLRKQTGRQVIHSFGPWGWAAVKVARALRGRVSVLPIMNVYTTMENEARAKLRGMNPKLGAGQRITLSLEYLWFIAVVAHFERVAYRRSAVVAFNYESVRRMHVKRWGTQQGLRKLPYTPETAFLRTADQRGDTPPGKIASLTPIDAPLIVAVSRHDARKGNGVLLHALAILRDRGVLYRAVLVGGGILHEGHRRLARDLRLEDQVTLEGKVPDSYAYHLAADIFVLPSIQEGSGSVSLLEALQAGTAIVASNIDGIPEDVVHEESALLVDAGDPSALADALTRLIKDVGLREKLQSNARQLFDRRFSSQVLVEALAALYDEFGHGSH